MHGAFGMPEVDDEVVSVLIGRRRIGQLAHRPDGAAGNGRPGQTEAVRASGIKPLSGAAPRVAVVGGSIGGLTAALVLRALDCEVDVYERASTPLEGAGGRGSCAPRDAPMADRPGRRPGRADEHLAARCATSARDGSVAYERPSDLQFTAWNTLYLNLLGDFGEERYHRGAAAADVADGGVRLAGGASPRPTGRGRRRRRLDAALAAPPRGALATRRPRGLARARRRGGPPRGGARPVADGIT